MHLNHHLLCTTLTTLIIAIYIPQQSSCTPAPPPDIRVSLAHGGDRTRVRVSSISNTSPNTIPPSTPYSPSTGYYQNQFQYRWTQFTLTSSYQPVNTPATITDNFHTVISTPPRGTTTRGVFIADPCISSIFVPCPHGIPYDTPNRIPWLLNAAASDTDYWGVLGDNLYDLDGSLSSSFFAKLSPQIKLKPLLAVVGNHDYWNWGHPPSNAFSQPAPDQVGYGFMQYWAIDTMSATMPHATSPFDFSFNPNDAQGHGLVSNNLPSYTNFFFYSALGNTGFIGYSAAHNLSSQFDAFENACGFFNSQRNDIAIVMLLGHWDFNNDGAQPGMDTPTLFTSMQSGQPWVECHTLAISGSFVFVSGHTHINSVIMAQQGVRVAGQGSYGTNTMDGSFGLPLFEVFSGQPTARLVVTYIPIALNSSEPLSVVNARYAALQACYASTNSLFECGKMLGVIWMNQTLGGGSSAPTIGPDSSDNQQILAIALGVTFGMLFLFGFGVFVYLGMRKSDADDDGTDEERAKLIPPQPSAAVGAARPDALMQQ